MVSIVYDYTLCDLRMNQSEFHPLVLRCPAVSTRLCLIPTWLFSNLLFKAYTFFVVVQSQQSCPTTPCIGIFQTKYQSGLPFPFSRVSFPPRDHACLSCVAGRFFTTQPPDTSLKLKKNKKVKIILITWSCPYYTMQFKCDFSYLKVTS